ncbi:hypothetical protein ACLOJK_009435 [Asimina triloba]
MAFVLSMRGNLPRQSVDFPTCFPLTSLSALTPPSSSHHQPRLSWPLPTGTGLACSSPSLAILTTNGSMTSTHPSCPMHARRPLTHQNKPISSSLAGYSIPSFLSFLFCPAPQFPFFNVLGCEERSPEPKPRWNPKPEQIQILEAIFNSGMVNPPREEIRKIRAQLQEYGQVGDANVFYWFQNRKSRSKHKQRHLQQTPKTQSPTTASPTITAPTISSSSSSSEKSSASADKAPALALGGGGTPTFIDIVNSPTASVNQTYFQSHGDFAPESFLCQMQQPLPPPHGCCFPELSNMLQMTEPAIGSCSGGLLSELMNQEALRKEREKIKMEQQQQQQERSYLSASTTIAICSTMNEIQGCFMECSCVYVAVFNSADKSGAGGGPFD